MNNSHNNLTLYLFPFISLNNQTGVLHTMGTINEGVYHFEVAVFCRVWQKEVISSVTVTVQEIGDDAVFNSGSLRLNGMCVMVSNNSSIAGYSKRGRLSSYSVQRTSMHKHIICNVS